MFKLFKYFKKSDWLFTALLIVIVALQVNLDLMLPDLMGDIVGFIQYNALYEEPLREILRTGGLMLLVVAGGFVCKLFSNLIASHITSKLARTLRSKIFKNVNSFSMEEMEKFSTASLITRTTNDVMQIQQTMMMLLKFGIIAPVMAISAVVRVVNSSLELSLATGVAVVALLLIIMTVFLVASPKFSVMQKKVDRLNGVTRENLTGLRVVRAYNAEDYQTEKFRDANEDLTRVNMFVNKVMCIMFPGMNLVMSGLMLTIYWLGASLINAGNLDYSTMAVFSQYSMQVLMSFLVLCMLLVVMPRANVSAKRIIEVIDTKSKIVEGERTQGEENEKGVVEFKNVSFRYPDAEEYVLHDISFKAERGQTVAFIGPTGSGKSTLAALLFSIPAVKGVEFGLGFGFAGLTGSRANDAFRMQGTRVVTATNHNGGVNGGISNGMPLVLRTVVKPTPSIYKVQQTVDCSAEKPAVFRLRQGQHSLRQRGQNQRRKGGGGVEGGAGGFCVRSARKDGLPHSAGRQKRVGRSASASVHSPRNSKESGNLYFRRQLFRIGLQDGLRAARRVEGIHKGRDKHNCRAENRYDNGR